ncbi:MAG: hypothetical protein E7638_08530 [Ruminococcaceae bacterium]|nr:hypothetical protein [Oscillospiraceae bacterium]
MKRKIVMFTMAVSMLFGLFGCAGGTGKADGWQEFTLSRSHMNAARCFRFHVFPNDAGQMLAEGYCTDREGREHRSEDGIVLSEDTVTQLRGMALEKLPNVKKKLLPPFEVMDGEEEQLILYDSRGRAKQKEPDRGVTDAVFEAILSDFCRELTSFSEISIHVSGMRHTVEYELVNTSGNAELKLYRITFADGEDRRQLEGTIECDAEEMLALLRDCRFLNWNGFDGPHPDGVLDGEMFRLYAVVNDGMIIRAEGSENFPDGYHELIRAFDGMLSE